MIADYYNCLSRLDTLVGDLLKKLGKSGKAENTIVVYLGDHGADMFRGKRTCYEGGLRVPLSNQENLRRLAKEVRSVTSKKASKKRAWGYPDYFFPR